MTEKYTRGQVCDLTGKDRTVVVHYICSHAGNTFLSIEELLSCQYVAILGSPELCKLGDIKEVSTSAPARIHLGAATFPGIVHSVWVHACAVTRRCCRAVLR